MRRHLTLIIGLFIALSGCKNTSTPEPESPPPAETTPAAGTGAPLPSDAGLRSTTEFADIADDRERSLALYAEMTKVLLHPRCVNCHPAGDRPLQTEAGWLHQPLVVRGEDNHGAPAMECGSCHGDANYLRVPGHPKWHLAPLVMAWQDRSPGEICRQIKDPERNDGKDLEALVDHMANDSLVGYGWNPPDHLEPAPGNQALFGQLSRAWVDSGAHCP